MAFYEITAGHTFDPVLQDCTDIHTESGSKQDSESLLETLTMPSIFRLSYSVDIGYSNQEEYSNPNCDALATSLRKIVVFPLQLSIYFQSALGACAERM